MISYAPFWKTAEERGVSTYALIHKHGVANGTLYRMRKGKPITTVTINQLCQVLQCRVEDILRYIPDEKQPLP